MATQPKCGTVAAYVNDCRCDKCRTAWSQYHQQLYRNRIAIGQCVRCRDRALPGQTRCERHRLQQTAAGKAA